MRWQKAARYSIAVFIVGFAIVVFLALRKTGPAPVAPERLAIDDKAVVQTSGRRRVEAADKAARSCSRSSRRTRRLYEDGRNVFEHATLTLPDRDGRTITITADEAEATNPAEGSADFSTAVVRGNVKLRTSDELVVTCNEGTFNDKDRHAAGARAGDVHPRPDDRHRQRGHLRPHARRAVAAGRRAHHGHGGREGRRRAGGHGRHRRPGARRPLHPAVQDAPTSSPTTGPSTPTT